MWPFSKIRDQEIKINQLTIALSVRIAQLKIQEDKYYKLRMDITTLLKEGVIHKWPIYCNHQKLDITFSELGDKIYSGSKCGPEYQIIKHIY